MKRVMLFGLLFLAAFLLAGGEKTVIVGKARLLELDGKLDEMAWTQTPAYAFVPGIPFAWGKPIIDRTHSDRKVAEPGTVRFLCDEKYFYLGIEMQDSDLAGEATSDEERLYMKGDTVEIFLHPTTETWYWEFYASVNEKKTAFFFPGRGRLNLPSNQQYACKGMIVKTHCDGTLNDWRDRDRGWSAEIAIPIAALTEFGTKFDNTAQWSILVVRYNYSRYLPIWEMTTFPGLSSDNPHVYEDYSPLDLPFNVEKQ